MYAHRPLGARTILAGIAAALLLALVPSVAHAGQVGVTTHIKGSGSTAVVEGSLEGGATGACNWTSNKDERVTNSCTRFRNEEPGEAWVWLRATPSAIPAGHWRFAGWTGCDTTREREGHTECAVHSGLLNSVERSPTAVFADDFAPTVSAVSEIFSTTVERRVGYVFSTDEGQAECRFDAEVNFGPCSSGVTRTYTQEGTHTIDVRAVDQSGQVSGTSSRTVTVIDTTATGPSGLTNSRSATFNFSSGAGNDYLCSLDFAAFTDCGTGSSKTYTNLGDGQHNLRVYAVNGGWFDRIPVSLDWTVDGTAPNTTISGTTPAEAGVTTATSALLPFASSELGSTFECSLDDGAFSPCTSPRALTGLAPGAHTFRVRARDIAGNVDATPAERSWTVVPPDGDGDGYNAAIDCDDADAAIHPGKQEIPDNDVDEDCDGTLGKTPPAKSPDPGPPVVNTPTPSSSPSFIDRGRDLTAPIGKLSIAPKQRLAKALKGGLLATGASTEAGRLRLDVFLDGKLAKRLKLSRKTTPVLVATSGDRPLDAPGAASVVLKFTPKAKKALARRRSVGLTLRLTATDAAGNAGVKTTRVTLKR